MNVTELVGKTLTAVNQVGDEEIWFTTSEGKQYRMFHAQNCCESVTIESITGDLTDLVGAPILIAEEVSSHSDSDCLRRSTWTFYKFATRKGYVDIRWFGESNGYYSEAVDFEEIEEEE